MAIWRILVPYLRLGRFVVRKYVIVPLRRVIGRRIPIAMVTGTKGKTTTTRMLAHILSEAGHIVGYTSTDGVVVNGEYLNRYDYADYNGARILLAQPSITAAVLETARGGLLKLGLYRDRCNVAALLNVGREQIGIDGIETLEQMAILKQRVINAARDAVVLNADDVLCTGMINRYPVRRLILFSLKADNFFVKNHIDKGGIAYVLNGLGNAQRMERWERDKKLTVIYMSDLPAAGNGVFFQNIANALAAAAMAERMGISFKTIGRALQSFKNSMKDSPGHLNFIAGYAQTILLDTIASVPSCKALVQSLDLMQFSGPRVCMYTTPGNRPPWHYTELGEILCSHFDHFICYELDHYVRGRAPGELSKLLKEGLEKAGVASQDIDTATGYAQATDKLSQVVGKNELVVILVANAHKYMPIFRNSFSQHKITAQ